MKFATTKNILSLAVSTGGLAIAPSQIIEAAPVSLIDQIEQYQQAQPTRQQAQVNHVFQLRDVAPSDWAFDALRNLVEKYNCLVGYPDGTFRGQKALSRYEFAAGLNACLQQLEKLAVTGNGGVEQPDMIRLRRLTEEFQTELASLGSRVDNLEGRTGFLENHQFSTTTKLDGHLVFAAIGTNGGTAAGNQVTFGDRLRLNLDTSFTGKDNLRVRLQAINAINPDLGTAEGSLAFADGESGNNHVTVDALNYTFPLTEKLNVAIAANGAASDDFASTLNFFDGDGDSGAVTRFGTRNPIYYQIQDKGIGLDYALSDKIRLSAGYLTPHANNPAKGAGLFNGAYGAMGQLHLMPSKNVEVAFTYLNGYNLSDTGTGSNNSNIRALTDDELPTSSHSYGIEASWQVNQKLVLGGWLGYSKITALSDLGSRVTRGSLDVWNWAATAALPDLFTKGATGGLIIGMEPKVTHSTVTLDGNSLADPNTSLHIETFYQYPINDHITITPALVWLTAPDHNNSHDDILIGTIRTSFSF